MSNFEDQWNRTPKQNGHASAKKLCLRVVFLPERLSSLPPKAVEHIATGGYKLIKQQSEGDNYTLNFYNEEE